MTRSLRIPGDPLRCPTRAAVDHPVARADRLAAGTGPSRIVVPMASPKPFALEPPAVLRERHVRSASEPIRFPTEGRVFPADILHASPPVVVDANRLREDILYACTHSQRTVLITAANAGLFRLFCAHHVVDEVFEHSGDWTEGTDVTRNQFIARWILEYLPTIHVVPDSAILQGLLDPDERERLQRLATIDPDDVPSATLALLLEAFFLSNDGPALRAVYGERLDLLDHTKWLEILRAGSDAGELARMFQLGFNLTQLAATGLVSGIKRLLSAARIWVLLPIGLLGAVAVSRASVETKHRLKEMGSSIISGLFEALAVYYALQARFAELAPEVPDWETLAATSVPQAVLARACLHTLARSPEPERSAAELTKQLPVLPVPQGEVKVRHVLRTYPCFTEVWRGRWQVGEVAAVLARYLALRSESRSDETTSDHTRPSLPPAGQRLLHSLVPGSLE
jgi:predicted nucleic acid-binding protein